jgi:hypothetical protein
MTWLTARAAEFCKANYQAWPHDLPAILEQFGREAIEAAAQVAARESGRSWVSAAIRRELLGE